MPQLRPGSILIFLFQLVCFTLFAQTDFREGFILQPNGDTLKGWIDYRSDGPNQDLCRFRATPNGPLETFAPDQIPGYGFPGDKFFVTGYVDNARQNPVFLEYLVRGLADLYVYRGRFYLKRGELPLVDISPEAGIPPNSKELQQEDARRIIRLVRQYLSCGVLDQKIKNIDINERKLVQFVRAYNECMDSPYTVFKKEQPWTILHPVVTLAGTLSDLAFESPSRSDEYFNHSSFDPEFKPNAMAGVRFDFPRTEYRLGAEFGVWYQDNRFIGVSQTDEAGILRRYDLEAHIRSVKVPLSFLYHFPDRKWNPYLRLGVGPVFTLESEGYVSRESQFSGLTSTDYYRWSLDERLFFSFFGGAGIPVVRLGRFRLYSEFRAERESPKIFRSFDENRGSGYTIQALFLITF
ncbi:MAG: hypothetical protein IPN20_21200 [Haliscomenobacter sp.]|nr:hypothetical protein [Haliscomenobacter sp.]MBK8656369.1 hypothetical protein [Haliscomenobacter sp.]